MSKKPFIFLTLKTLILASCGEMQVGNTKMVPDSKRLSLIKGLPTAGYGSLASKTENILLSIGVPATNKLRLNTQKAQEDNKTYQNELYYDGIPLCEYTYTSSFYKDGILLLGRVPESKELPPLASLDIPNPKDAAEMSMERARNEGIHGPFKLLDQSPCYIIRGEELKYVYLNTIQADHLAYRSLADNFEAYTLEKNHYHVDRKAKTYISNPKDGKFATYTLKGLDTSGYLTSNTHSTVLYDGQSSDRAVATNGVYDFTSDTSSSEFMVTSAYTNVDRTITWFKSLGFKPPDRPMTVVTGALFDGSANNAMYQPAVKGTKETIFIGLGDGEILKNLAVDADVVSHEYAHHVIFQNLQGISQDEETLILHEGLADFFTFARTGDACLGESICPEDSFACAIRAQCLRSAANEFTRSDLRALQQAHLQGQLISGFFWDLYLAGHRASSLARLVLATLQLMPQVGVISDLVVGVVAADYNEFDQQFCKDIKKVAKDRGLDDLYPGEIDCSSSAEPTLPKEVTDSAGVRKSAQRDAENTLPSRSTTQKGSICGAIAANTSDSLLLTLLFFIPILLAVFPREKQPVRIRARHKSKPRP